MTDCSALRIHQARKQTRRHGPAHGIVVMNARTHTHSTSQFHAACADIGANVVPVRRHDRHDAMAWAGWWECRQWGDGHRQWGEDHGEKGGGTGKGVEREGKGKGAGKEKEGQEKEGKGG